MSGIIPLVPKCLYGIQSDISTLRLINHKIKQFYLKVNKSQK